MATPLKILFLSAEVVPFAKTGGLGDVGGALPKFLRALGHDVRVVLPAYRAIETDYYAGRGGYTAQPEGLLVPVRGQGRPAGVLEGRLPGTDVPVYFIGERSLFDRPELYGYDDDVYRFAFYSRAALVLAESLGWRPDLVHAHDWHSAPALTWLATAGQASDFWRGVASLFTIHNLAHQGRASWDIFNYLGLSTTALHEEPYGSVNFMARGIYHATLVNTVSPTYAREIMTPAGGAGLDGLLRHRAYDVHGLLNGLDYSVWNPATDRRLTVWEMVHQLVRALDTSESAAATLVARLGSQADTARELAYRLYTLCERKKRAQEALAYNSLVQSWPEIVQLAREGGEPRTQQAQVFEEE